MNATTALLPVEVTCDAVGLTSRAGTAALTALADRVGLTNALTDGLSCLFSRRVAHEPGRIARDVAVMLADGGDALCDLGVLRDQPTLFGHVASSSTAHRFLHRMDAAALTRVRNARARARKNVWGIAETPRRVVLDIDATLVTSHSEKEGAAGTYKRGFRFHPLVCFEASTGEGLSGILRPGNAGSNTAKDHIEVLALSLDQLPEGAIGPGTLVRCDSGGATHAFLDAVVACGLSFSVGLDATKSVREACLAVPGDAWRPALAANDEVRDGAAVAELKLDMVARGWPEGTRAICRRERPHPGAQLTFSDIDGHRFQVFITNQKGRRIARLEQLHRRRAAVEDSIRCAKATGLRNLPCHGFAANAAWLELVLMGCDLLAWTRMLLLESTGLAAAEPKRLRYRLLHVAARIVTGSRRIRLRLPHDWPWAAAIATAFARLRALPRL
ncbi:MAG: IS1380 family transposase [Actinomycetota bacterium]|nr:IS1380 family transposase [Actinomycetota bacterium]